MRCNSQPCSLTASLVKTKIKIKFRMDDRGPGPFQSWVLEDGPKVVFIRSPGTRWLDSFMFTCMDGATASFRTTHSAPRMAAAKEPAVAAGSAS